MYPGVKRQSDLKGPIVWQGREYPSGVLPPENVVWEILWELYELNFIYELQSLDRRACQNTDLLSNSQLINREVEISHCFPHQLILTCADSLRKLWIGWWWLRKALPVCHSTNHGHEFMERRQTCNTGVQSLWFRIVSRQTQGIGEHCCKILLPTIL